ncbi:MAG: hypothetical protein ORN28_00010 [Rhodoferax sp.]|nr:hypothetical protein [Rhodoferax sp.]
MSNYAGVTKGLQVMHSQRLYVETQPRLAKRLQKCFENLIRSKPRSPSLFQAAALVGRLYALPYGT